MKLKNIKIPLKNFELEIDLRVFVFQPYKIVCNHNFTHKKKMTIKPKVLNINSYYNWKKNNNLNSNQERNKLKKENKRSPYSKRKIIMERKSISQKQTKYLPFLEINNKQIVTTTTTKRKIFSKGKSSR